MGRRRLTEDEKVKRAMDGQKAGKNKQQAEKQDKPQQKKEKKVKDPKTTHVIINCVDCNSTREIKVQDKFQVKRCKPCQVIYAKKRKNEYKKNKITELKAENDRLKKLVPEEQTTQ